MADNSFCELDFTQNSETENEDSNKFDSESYSSDILTLENTDVTDFEKHVIFHKKNLQQRLRDLQVTMDVLKEQLAEEKYMWEKELNESRKESYLYETKIMPKIVLENTCQMHINENAETPAKVPMSASEYQEKLTKYEDALLKAHAEKRASLKRQISINNYKRQLLEVENLCNLELLRVKQSVQFLQPLQMIASEWKRSSNESMVSDVEITGIQKKKLNKEYLSEPSTSEEKLVLEFADTPLDGVGLIKSNESFDYGKSTQITQIWDEDQLNSSHSNVWYSSGKYIHSAVASDNERFTTRF
ncbi:hypothetical protein RI129_000735 [Pyrocoelia pectoralis]|uniref:Uncharacterized protein n=1 Tax=Pyrocoelia pectoralis TaxID=417401 RepID=A0AAN7VS30_9COLE